LYLVHKIIREDPLHRNGIKMMAQEIGARVFGQWSMAFQSPEAGVLAPLAHGAYLPSAPVSTEAVSQVLSMFMHRHSVSGELVESILRSRIPAP
jgi:hypothetical protein